jgi:hypothetical protein
LAVDYWPSSGYRLLTVGSDNRLTVTDDFLRTYLVRPELAPVRESSFGELALHDALLADPRMAVGSDALAAVADEDARGNYAIWLRFRARLLAASSLEAAYVGLFKGEGVDVPPLFVEHLTQVLVRHVLGPGVSAFEARAGEMLFRPQRIAVLEDGAVMAADDATVELFATTAGFGSLGELLAQNRTPARSVDLDVLDPGTADQYWERDERHDFSVSLNRGRPALEALCRVLERWIAHFLGVRATLKHERAFDDAHWVWHVGLDAEASALLNDLYNEAEVDEARLARLLCLFRLDFENPADMRPAIAGRPVYLAMAMNADNVVKLKPQNLLLNLPLASAQ